MPTEIQQFPQRDEGTGTVSQREEPETFESKDHEGDPTGVATQQDAEVTVVADEHTKDPTGVVSERSEPETFRDPTTQVIEEAEAKRRRAAETKKRTATKKRSAKNK